MNDLISVIVPVYNVEKYLDRCVESIVNQTYKNLEIILVDDGSPDNCPQMCDDWAKKDSRIKVIHKENDGLANARNSGIEICTGDYVLFVDSDDYIDLDMVEFLNDLAIKYNADVSRCGFYTLVESSEIETSNKNDGEIKIYNFSERMKDLMSGNHISGVAWNKLYKNDIIKTHLYNKADGCSEDIMHNFRVYLDVDKTAFCDEPKYHYLIRNNSITNSEFGDGAFAIIRAKQIMIDYFKEDDDLYQYAVNSFITSAFVVLTGCIRNDYFGEKYYELIDLMKKYYCFVMKSSLFSLNEKVKIFMIKFFPKIYRIAIKRKYKV